MTVSSPAVILLIASIAIAGRPGDVPAEASATENTVEDSSPTSLSEAPALVEADEQPIRFDSLWLLIVGVISLMLVIRVVRTEALGDWRREVDEEGGTDHV